MANHSRVRLIKADPASSAATRNISGPAPLWSPTCSASAWRGIEATPSPALRSASTCFAANWPSPACHRFARSLAGGPAPGRSPCRRSRQRCRPALPGMQAIPRPHSSPARSAGEARCSIAVALFSAFSMDNRLPMRNQVRLRPEAKGIATSTGQGPQIKAEARAGGRAHQMGNRRAQPPSRSDQARIAMRMAPEPSDHVAMAARLRC
jgi:hypothetical protein